MFSPEIKNKMRYVETWTVTIHYHRAHPDFHPVMMDGFSLNEVPCLESLLVIMFSPDIKNEMRYIETWTTTIHHHRPHSDCHPVIMNGFSKNEVPCLKGLLVIMYSSDIKNKMRFLETWTVIIHHHRSHPDCHQVMMNGFSINEVPCLKGLLVIMFSPDIKNKIS